MGSVIEPSPGSYMLGLYLSSKKRLSIGKQGSFEFKRGHYLYCGSAQGPGGLKARISHHLKPSARPHWHIDYLKQAAAIRHIWFAYGPNMEHLWAQTLAGQPNCVFPIPGFGSSDCDCPSHLLFSTTSFYIILDDLAGNGAFLKVKRVPHSVRL